ncbi:MAG: nucleoside deaminase [Pseudomonadota bacterium]
MKTTEPDHDERLRETIELAMDSVQTEGGPFGAVVYRGDEQIARACNRVMPYCDPTAHAEIMALRRAGRRSGNPHLEGCTLYASCQPCPMCLAAALWARVERIIHAAPHTEAQRAGFDDSEFARQLYGQTEPVALPPGFVLHRKLPEASRPFDAWLARQDRAAY